MRERLKIFFSLPLLLSLLIVGVLQAWMYYLSINVDEAFDEAEHCHAAWMIAKQGWRPLEGFFQHHMPLFWDALKVFFLLGGDGPEVLFFGRFLVLVSVACFVLGLWIYLRQIGLQEPSRRGNLLSFGLCLSLLVSLAMLFPSILVIRPESLAMPFIVWALVAWKASHSKPSPTAGFAMAALAGVLGGTAVYFTPRVLLLGGLFFLTNQPPSARRLWREHVPALLLGVVVAFVVYPLLLGHDPRFLWFAFRFSAHLQKVGLVSAIHILPFLEPFFFLGPCLAAYCLLLLHFLLPPEKRPRFWLHLGNLGVVLGVSIYSSWPHVCPQNFFCTLLCLVLLTAEFAPSLDWDRLPLLRRAVVLTLMVCFLDVAGFNRYAVQSGRTLAESVKFRRSLLERLEPGDTVMISYPSHPITVADSIFYGPGLTGNWDSPGRICQAVNHWAHWPKLPECQYLDSFLEAKPALVDSKIAMNVPSEKQRALMERLQNDYFSLNGDIFLMKSRIRQSQ